MHSVQGSINEESEAVKEQLISQVLESHSCKRPFIREFPILVILVWNFKFKFYTDFEVDPNLETGVIFAFKAMFILDPNFTPKLTKIKIKNRSYNLQSDAVPLVPYFHLHLYHIVKYEVQ